MLSLAVSTFPTVTHAGILDFFFGSSVVPEQVELQQSVRSMALPTPATNIDPNPVKGTTDIVVQDDIAVPSEGPIGTVADIATTSHQISVHEVRAGESLASIAALYKVTVDTIRWANGIQRGTGVKKGQQLVILPVAGIKYTVKKGDTVQSVAKKYSSDPDDIRNFNGMLADDALAAGDSIIIPEGELFEAAPTKRIASRGISPIKTIVASFPRIEGYYMRPVVNAKRTQGIHGFNGVDLGGPIGEPILASAAGTVIIARNSGWNGGYGKYVVIQHANGTQTLYGHASEVFVSAGQTVAQGENIAALGNTGKSTGPHLHFEIRGAKNPF
jgi:LysM repeat protein